MIYQCLDIIWHSRFYPSYDLPHVLHAPEDVVVVQLFVGPHQDVCHAVDEGD